MFNANEKMKNKNKHQHTFKKLLLASSLIAVTGAASAGYEIKISDEDKISPYRVYHY